MRLPLILGVSFLCLFDSLSMAVESNPPAPPAVEQAFGNLPIYFIENRGQIDSEDVAYYVKGADKTLYFMPDGITFALRSDSEERWAVKLTFIDAPPVAPVGVDEQTAVFSYFKGKPEDWKAGVPAYGKLVYEDLWPGIDLVYSGTVNQLKYEFVVDPGADPSLIRLCYQGATDVSVNNTAALCITTPAGGFEDATPYAYQLVDGKESEVSMSYALEETGGSDAFTYGFDVGDFDPRLPLILDPSMFVYCGYIGGDRDEHGAGIAVDSDGNAYVAGFTFSDETSFPVMAGPDLTHGGSGYRDAFVAKVNTVGTNLVYCGYIGGDDWDEGLGLSIDGSGNAYVTGNTNSSESSFPVIAGPDLTFNGTSDTFVAKVSTDGTSLVYCGYIGGDSFDGGVDIAVSSDGQAFVIGGTVSSEATFPVVTGPDLTFNGSLDVFIAKVNAGGTGLDYCGYIGGVSEDECYGLSIDGSGNAYVVGLTGSNESTFPVAIGPDLTSNGSADAFIAKVNANGNALDYCGYIGGAQYDGALGIAVDSNGNAYVAGFTDSNESSFPVAVGPDLTFNGITDAFVAKVNGSGTALDYCGYIGGIDDDTIRGIAVDVDGNAFVVGRTESDETSFPVTIGPDLTYVGDDAFVARVNPTGADLDFCGYVGGSSYDDATDIALDEYGNAYFVGSGGGYGFPEVVGPDLTHNGSIDAFVAKLPPYHVLLRAGNVVTGSYNPKDVLFINGSAGDDCYRTIVNPSGTPVSIAMLDPPGGPKPVAFALYAWRGEAVAADVVVQPFGIGVACFPMPLSNGAPWAPPITVANNIGYPFKLGQPLVPNIPQAPAYIVRNKILTPGTWTIQGLIYDDYSSGPSVSLTNAIVLIQQ